MWAWVGKKVDGCIGLLSLFLVGDAVWLSHVIPFYLFLTCIKKDKLTHNKLTPCELSDVMGGSSYECVFWLQWAGAGMGGWVEVSEIPFRLRRFLP